MQSPRILLISGTGLLGRQLHASLKNAGLSITATSRTGKDGTLALDLEKCGTAQLAERLAEGKFTHGILSAAMADPEECFRNPAKARKVNVDSMVELLSLFKELGIMPIFFSTDLVFDCSGDLYEEGDPVRPSTLYAKQKAEIETLVRNSFEHHLILRLSKLMSLDLNPRNILAQVVHTIQRGETYRAFEDQNITPIFSEDVAAITAQAILANLVGTYHLAGKERLSRVEIAKRVCDAFGLPFEKVAPSRMADVKFSEPRGLNHTMSSDKISKDLDFRFTPLDEGLMKMKESKT